MAEPCGYSGRLDAYLQLALVGGDRARWLFRTGRPLHDESLSSARRTLKSEGRHDVRHVTGEREHE